MDLPVVCCITFTLHALHIGRVKSYYYLYKDNMSPVESWSFSLTLQVEVPKPGCICKTKQAGPNIVLTCFFSRSNTNTLYSFILADRTVENEDDMEMEIVPPDEPQTSIKFTYHTHVQMTSILKKTEEQCSSIATTYSIGRSTEGRELLVIEFSNNPGQHELRKLNSSVSV